MSNTYTKTKISTGITDKASKMFSKRGFVHHYIGEGQEEFEFVSALEDVNSLVNEYKSLENDYNNEGEEEEKEEESNK
jgi:tubulin alpha